MIAQAIVIMAMLSGNPTTGPATTQPASRPATVQLSRYARATLAYLEPQYGKELATLRSMQRATVGRAVHKKKARPEYVPIGGEFRDLPEGATKYEDGSYSFEAYDLKRAAVRDQMERMKELKQRIDAAKRGKWIEGPPLKPPFNTGKFGRFVADLSVRQVIDSNNALVIFFEETRSAGGRNGFWESPEYNHIWLWIETDTTGWADDTWQRPPGNWEVAGMRQYTTVTGATRTVPVLKRVK